MKRMSCWTALAVSAAFLVFATAASATRVTTTTGGAAATPTLAAVNEGGHVVFANSIANIECSSTLEGKIESHGIGVAASGNLSSWEFIGCTNSWHVTTEKAGSLSITYTSGHNGSVVSNGTLVKTTRFLVPCNYETANTKIGTLTGGNPATLNLEASIPIASGSSELCGGGNAKWEGAYTSDWALYIAS